MTFERTSKLIQLLFSNPQSIHQLELLFWSIHLLSNCESDLSGEYLANLDWSEVIMHFIKQGTVAFSRIPLVIISGPLGSVQCFETSLLSLINYPILVTTHTTRMVMAANE